MIKKAIKAGIFLFLTGPLIPATAAAYTTVSTANAYMVENTSGTDSSGNVCYDFQTRPGCSTFIAGISTGSIPGGSTQYIQNSGTPTTATQVYSVSSGSVTGQFTVSTVNVTNALLMNGSAGTAGQVLTSNGPGTVQTYQSAGASILNSTNTWTGGNTFRSTTTLVGNVVTQGQILAASGSQGTPSYSFSATSNTGIFSNGVGVINLTASNTDVMDVSNSALTTNVTTNIKGDASGSSALTGYVGEYISAYANAVSFPATGNFGDLTSINLTAGDWDVTALVDIDANSATVTEATIGISTTTGNSQVGLSPGDNRMSAPIPLNAVRNSATTIPVYRVSTSGAPTYFLKVRGSYSAGTPLGSGRLSARRVR